MDENTKLLIDISERLAGVEATLNTMTNVEITATDAKEIANSAQTSARSAHKRIDKIDKAMFWITTTIIGAVVVGVIALLIKNGGV